MGTHGMLQGRWDLTTACKSEVPRGFGLRCWSRRGKHRSNVPKSAGGYEHPGRAEQAPSIPHDRVLASGVFQG